jgi:hypothetical protein
MIIYRGRELNHWREKFDIADLDAWHVQGFLHYVNANGPFSEFKFDKRSSIGEKTIDKIPQPVKRSYIEYFDPGLKNI